MVNLLLRRRELIKSIQPLSEWDYEWDYTKGKLEEQTGWSYTISKTAYSEIISDGEKLIASSNNSYINLYALTGQANRFFTSGYGVLEVVCYGVWWNNSDAVNLRVTAAVSGTKRITLFVFNNQWRIYDNSTKANCTVLLNAIDNTKYTIRIVVRATVADVYINNVLAISDFSMDSTIWGSSNSVMGQNFGSARCYGVIQSLKLRHVTMEPISGIHLAVGGTPWSSIFAIEDPNKIYIGNNGWSNAYYNLRDRSRTESITVFPNKWFTIPENSEVTCVIKNLQKKSGETGSIYVAFYVKDINGSNIVYIPGTTVAYANQPEYLSQTAIISNAIDVGNIALGVFSSGKNFSCEAELYVNGEKWI